MCFRILREGHKAAPLLPPPFNTFVMEARQTRHACRRDLKMRTPPDNSSHAVYELVLLMIIGCIACALVAAANGAYTTDTCALRHHTNETESGHKFGSPSQFTSTQLCPVD